MGVLNFAHASVFMLGLAALPWPIATVTGLLIIMVFEQGMRAVRVSLVERLDNNSLRKIGRQFTGFSMARK